MRISLVIPCYNEESNLQKGVLDKIGNFTKDDDRFVKILIVDDGSLDKSKKIIKEKYLKIFPKFQLLERAHKGKAYAIIAGIKQAKSEYVAFIDIDLATPIEEMEKLIDGANQGYKIVIGSRNSRRRGAPILRKIMALGGMIIRDLLIGLKGIRDTQCGFKLFERETALKVIGKLQVFKDTEAIWGSSVSAAFDMEFLFVARILGYEIKEISVIWKHVETKNVNFIKDSLESFSDIFKIKYYQICGKYSTET